MSSGDSEDDGTKTCPYCAETIKAKAIVCRFCGRDLGSLTDTPAPADPPSQGESGCRPSCGAGCGILFVIVLLVIAAISCNSSFPSTTGESSGASESSNASSAASNLPVAETESNAGRSNPALAKLMEKEQATEQKLASRLPEAKRQKIFRAYVQADRLDMEETERAMESGEQPGSAPHNRHRRDVARTYGVTYDEAESISVEGTMQHWPTPPR